MNAWDTRNFSTLRINLAVFLRHKQNPKLAETIGTRKNSLIGNISNLVDNLRKDGPRVLVYLNVGPGSWNIELLVITHFLQQKRIERNGPNYQIHVKNQSGLGKSLVDVAWALSG